MRNELITLTDPKSPTSEMFRTLRTNLQFMSNSKKLQTILITSTLPGEGKSWTSANLAVTFAQAGKKVLIIDSDMRKGRQFSVFNVTARPGLSNYLSGVVNENEVENPDAITSYIRETNIENLCVVPAGDVPPNPSELLINSRMNQLLIDLKQIFDFIIFDAPPALLVTDATILARMVDTTMIVVAHQETKMENLAKAQKAIKNVGGNLAGVVINKMPMTVKKYQEMGYYGNEEDVANAKNASPDLYLRGKATILEDRNRNKETARNYSNNINSYTNPAQRQVEPKKETINQTLKTQEINKSSISETEEMLKRMREQLEEQRRKMENKN